MDYNKAVSVSACVPVNTICRREKKVILGQLDDCIHRLPEEGKVVIKEHLNVEVGAEKHGNIVKGRSENEEQLTRPCVKKNHIWQVK